MKRRIPILLAAAAACAGGVLRIWESGASDGFLLSGAGLVTLGVWLCLEVLDREDK